MHQGKDCDDERREDVYNLYYPLRCLQFNTGSLEDEPTVLVYLSVQVVRISVGRSSSCTCPKYRGNLQTVSPFSTRNISN